MFSIFEQLREEIQYTTSRSSGKGGQHANKVESRVSLFFDIKASELFNDEQKKLLLKAFESRLNQASVLQLDVEESRSQSINKGIAYKRLCAMIEEALKPKKKRKPTKPTKASEKKRLNTKKARSELKKLRRKDKLL
jgi:ribosome-associated protein